MRQKMLNHASCTFFFLVLFGCATITEPVHVKRQENEQSFKAVVSGKKVFILKPFISTTTTDSETPVQPESTGAIELANLIENSARNVSQKAGASGFITKDDAALHNDLSREALQSLASNQHILLSYYKDKSVLKGNLQTIAQATGTELLCAYSIVVKVGGGSGWNPISGQIWQGTSSTSVKAVLISTSTGKILWGNEIFVRTLASDKQCVQAVEKLFVESE
jgi:hypothetical protein